MKMDKAKGIWLTSCIYGFLLTLIFVVLFICAGVGFGAFNSRSISRSIYGSEYYNKVYLELMDKAGIDLEYTGLPRTVLEDVITREKVYIAGKNYMEAALRGETPEVNAGRLKEELTDKINQYFKAKGMTGTLNFDSDVEQVVNVIHQKYIDAISLPFLEDFVSFRQGFFSVITFLVPLLIVLAGVLSYFLLRMHRYLHRGLRFIAYAVISATALMFVGMWFLRMRGSYADAVTGPGYYHNFVTVYQKWSAIVFGYIGGIGVIISLILISFISFLKNRLKSY